ncbi:DUF4913 domain-containing protein [Georgenia daeguensis]|uniref:DUF4913 domain-containing protein n=1 Tax=Georgenia daeguensis TaxID=908355 RepID=A0ABP6UM10_9MICO
MTTDVLNGWDEAEELIDARTEQAGGDETAPEEPTLYYGSVDEFVREYLRQLFRRRVGPNTSAKWAAEWWRHPEAIVRLEALWRAWEHLRLDPATGMSVWLRDHADYHMGVLLSPDGPFKKSQDANRDGEPLPYTEPPAGMFPDVSNRK